ncbi:hypothetical protein VTK73DRAFT_2910 [Phialemonium thermophilum]|uniref:Uncharacterized protein n=1 Tax=Phialemonium thermophilum TaxID=223376 RepID=A0ABR3VMK9_9PEZI
MATTLWPVIHRLSCLPSLKAELERAVRADPLSCKVTVLRTEFEASVEAIETALLAWQPNLPSNFFPDGSTHRDFETLTLAASCRASEANTPSPACASPSCGPSAPCPASHPPHAHIPDRHGLHSILHNAMAYRHSALVYLYRNIHGLGRRHAAVQQHAHAALAHCEATVRARGPMGALLWPLFVAACEAVTDVDRDLAGAAFEGIERRQGMLNIGRAWEIVVEVWRRADAADGEGAEEETGVLTSGGDDPLQSGDGRDPSVQTQEALVGLRQASDDEEGDARLAARGDGRQLDGAGSFESQGMPSGGVSHAGSAPRGHGGPGMRAAAAKPRRAGRGADLWRLVSQDMGVHIVFG